MNKIIFCLVSIAFMALPAHAANVFDYPLEDITTLEKALYNPEKISGTFTQVKYLRSLDVTLSSEGTFAISKEAGILWKNVKPLQTITIINNNAMCSFVNDKQTTISTQDNEALKDILNVVNSIFTQDYQKIAQYFDVYFVQDAQGYTLGFKAKDALVASVMETMTVSGNKYIEQVRFSDKNNDSTSIKFSELTETAENFSCE